MRIVFYFPFGNVESFTSSLPRSGKEVIFMVSKRKVLFFTSFLLSLPLKVKNQKKSAFFTTENEVNDFVFKVKKLNDFSFLTFYG